MYTRTFTRTAYGQNAEAATSAASRPATEATGVMNELYSTNHSCQSLAVDS